jgi:hypothetical protein
MSTLNIEDYIEHLDKQIAHHGTELEKAMNARELMARYVNRHLAPARREEPAKLEKPGKKPRKMTPPDRGAWAAAKERVLEMIRSQPPSTLKTSDIIRAEFGNAPYEKPKRDRIYGVLKELRDKNVVTLNDDHTYVLNHEHQAAA